jgi:cell division protein FtsL
MTLRLLNLVVIGALILAAAYVYRIKFDSAAQAERLAKLRGEVRHERDEIAALRAEWSKIDNPERVETLAKRYLKLKPIVPTQFDSLDRLPDRPPPPPEQEHVDARDPIGGMIDGLEEPTTTGSIPASAPPSGMLPPANGAPYPISGAPQR